MAWFKADLDTTKKFFLDKINGNVAGLVPLIERVVPSAYPNDIKARRV
ncbi:MAG: hypothetical protein CM15mV106_350 [uncultured marine virus]|nr:MAG: hypothetical protein CM15mV106_350 [uncultured marine virus]